MFLTLLLVTQTVAEWVEISQQHYRKPMHTYSIHNPFVNPHRIEVEDTTKSWSYSNKSVSEYLWNKSPMIQSNIGHIKEVNFDEGARKSKEDENNGVDINRSPNYESTRPAIDFNDNIKAEGTIEKVFNVGNVRRVQLGNSPVKSPALDLKSDSGIIAKNRYEEFPLENENFSDKMLNIEKVYVNNLKNRFSSEPNIFPTDRVEAGITEVNILRNRPTSEIQNHIHQPETLPSRTYANTETDKFIQKAKYVNGFQDSNITNLKHIKTNTENSNINEADIEKVDNELHKQQSSQQSYENFDPKSVIHEINNAPQTVHYNITDSRNNDGKIYKPEFSSHASQINGENVQNQHERNLGQNKEKKFMTKENNSNHNMKNLLKFIKVVADTISRNTKRSVKGKMNYLHDLKDAILANIAERIDATWPDDDVTATPHRSSRSTPASSRGHHVQFPSSESALMTISFLTFAVFLVKLVLQIIQTYKNKAMMVAPVLVASGARNLFSYHGNR